MRMGPDCLRQTHARENEIGNLPGRALHDPLRAVSGGYGRPDDDLIGPAPRQNRQGRIQKLAEFCATGFLAGIVGVHGASCVYKENVRFLCGRRHWDSSEGNPHGGGERQPVSPSRLQSQQGGSVSANVGSFSNNVGRSQITVSNNLGPKRRQSQVRRPIVSGLYSYAFILFRFESKLSTG